MFAFITQVLREGDMCGAIYNGPLPYFRDKLLKTAAKLHDMTMNEQSDQLKSVTCDCFGKAVLEFITGTTNGHVPADTHAEYLS